MVRETTQQHTLNNDWHTATSAFWRRYPSPYSRHVLAVDVLESNVDPQTGHLHVLRLLKKTNRKPKWMDMWFGDTVAYILESTSVDPATQTMTTRAKNVTLTGLMVMEEQSTIRADPSDSSRTIVDAQMRVYCPLPIRKMVEAWGVKRYIKNKDRSVDGLKWTIDQMKQDGVSTSPVAQNEAQTAAASAKSKLRDMTETVTGYLSAFRRVFA